MKHIISIVTLSLILLTSCKPATIVEDFIHVDVFYNGSLVTSITEPSEMLPYYDALLQEPTPNTVENSDLVYDLEIRTYDTLMTYKLLFDTTHENAVAVSQDGSFAIPYNWLDVYLIAKPIPNAYSYLYPPTFELLIDGYKMSYGVSQNWLIHPTDEVHYDQNFQDANGENYKSQKMDLLISGHFPSKLPDELTLKVIGINGTTIYENIDLSALPTPEQEGPYRYELSAHWISPEMGYSGTIVYNFGVSLSLPAAYKLNKTTYEPGDCMAILITKPKSLDYRVETATYAKTTGLFYLDQDLVGLLPLDSRTVPGDYELYIYEDSTDLLLDTLPYTVIEKEFDRQDLTVSSSTTALKSDDNYAKDAAKFGDAKAYSVGEKLWEGTFLQPVEGRISTEYSTIRYVNGDYESSRHSGLDIAAPRGTPILAANNGIVTFASDLIVSGNVIVLDHGYGVFTSYVHLDEIYVEDGQSVSKGDIIGAVGSTGYSTGPHLHWTVWKNGVYLNPWKFIEEDPLAVFE